MSWQHLFILVIGVGAVSLWILALREGYMTNLTPGKVKDDRYEVDDPFDRCILPKLDPWEGEIIPFLDLSYDPLKDCHQDFKPMTVLQKGVLQATLENVSCWGRCLNRRTERSNVRGPWVNITRGANFSCDIVESLCQDSNKKDIYQMVHAQIVEVNTSKKAPAQANSFNVYVILLDSTAATQATRNLPKTLMFLEKSMDAVTFPYVNKVGANSRPNGVAMWFGKSMEDIDRLLFGLPTLERDWTREYFCDRYLDNETSLFDEYAKKGYKTLLAEDWMNGTLNWPDCWGYNKQPTDHYMRPFQVALEYGSDTLTNTYSTKNCIEQHRDILRYLQDFVHSYEDHPKFGWIWLSLLSHDYETGLNHADSDYQRFFLDNKKKLDDSFVIFMGDHGLRFGEVTHSRLGSIEMNNPLFLMAIPKELRKNTNIIDILKENAAHLQTPYDIRATLLDILKYQPVKNFTDREFMELPGEYGTSFLRSQSDKKRTCKNLPIPAPYCICQFPMEPLNRSLPLATESGQFVLQHVNSILKENNVSELCETLRYNYTMAISAYAPEEITKTYVISVKAQAPCNGEFKATVRRTDNGFQMVSKSIERLDQFGESGDCVDDYTLMHLCHCKPYPQPTTNQRL